MHPVSIVIQGNFWDSQVYSGELTLFDANGGLHRIDWSKVIDDLATKNPIIQTALRVAFVDSDLFYTDKVRRILRDPQIDKVIRSQLRNLAKLSVEATREDWQRDWRTIDAPFHFLPTDTDIYYHYLFAAGDEGLYSAPRSAAAATHRRHRHHDGRVLQVKASLKNTALAAAGGADGLFEFEYETDPSRVLGKGQNLADIPCNACEWSLQSIMAWRSDAAYLASFREIKDPRSNRKHRSFDKIVRQEQMLDGQDVQVSSGGRMWGSHEKVFCIADGGLEVLDYEPPPVQNEGAQAQRGARFSRKGKLGLDINNDEIVSTGTAPFGTVLELDDKVVVLRSDGQTQVFDGEVVHWRVFPRSENYSNQLHLIYEDHIRVVSFMHDYFVDQKKKLTGFSKGANKYLNAGANVAAELFDEPDEPV